MSERTGRRWSFGNCEYVETSRRLTVDGKPVKMESKPLDVLLQLLESSGRMIAKEHLLDTVWADVETTEQSLTTVIFKLRKVFIGSSEPIIVTAPGVRYRMGVPVRWDAEPDSGSFPFALQPGDRIPGKPYWQALRASLFSDSCRCSSSDNNSSVTRKQTFTMTHPRPIRKLAN